MATLLAALLAAAPASAQVRTTTDGGRQTDATGRNRPLGANAAEGRAPAACPEGDAKRAGAQHCEPSSGDGNTGGRRAVFLPAILIDLFPNPQGGVTGSPPIPTPNPRAPQAGGSTGAGSQPTGGNSGSAPAAAPSPTVSPVAISGAFVPDEVLATVNGDAASVQQIANAFNLEIRSQRISGLLGVRIVRFGIPDGRPVPTVLAQLGSDGRVRQRAPNHVYGLQRAGSLVNYAFQRISLDRNAMDGANIRVAVIDTAADETNPALAGVIAETHDSMPETPVRDRNHGTSIAGLIAGIGELHGMAPGARIYQARAFDHGHSTTGILLDALDWAAGQNVRVMNMSFAGPKNDLLETACRAASARGIVLVAAAGNDGPDAPYDYPAAYEGVIAATATDEQDRLMQQANRGSYVFIAAPGVNVPAPIEGGQDLVTGTSFSAAIVSGAIADLLRAAPKLDARQIDAALAESASDLGAPGRDADFGFGLLDMRAALTQVAGHPHP
jgi:hypothetical protein